MASRQELINGIYQGMRLNKSFFMKVYGYELTWPGFAKIALDKLEQEGCSKAREYYKCIVEEWESVHEKEMKNIAKWLKNQGKDRKKVSDCKRNLQNLSNENLIRYLQNLTKEA